jgi:Ni,Fe-hydrogenase III small subunit
VLIVPVVGGTAAPLALEATVARRGWLTANSPADADILVVAGGPAPQPAAVVERVWHQVPAPRTRVIFTEPADAEKDVDVGAVLLGS